MIKNIIGSLALCLLCAANANAASMSISGPTDVNIGESFQLQIFGDFTGEGLIAGGINFLWDSALVQLDNIALNLPVIADFSCPGSVNCPPNTANSAPIVWGEFLSDLIDPADPAPVLMATLDFTSNNGPGLALFSMEDNLQLTGGWFGAGFSPIDSPSFGEGSVNIIPVPAAVWLFGSALGLLGWMRRKNAA